jgi:hypothetical protein
MYGMIDDIQDLMKRIAALEAELAALREDKARLVEALERICTHSRDADCGDHCSNACMYCQGRAAIDAARKESRGLRRCGSRGTRTRSRRKGTPMPKWIGCGPV